MLYSISCGLIVTGYSIKSAPEINGNAYSPTNYCSTISANMLNFSVRNG